MRRKKSILKMMKRKNDYVLMIKKDKARGPIAPGKIRMARYPSYLRADGERIFDYPIKFLMI